MPAFIEFFCDFCNPSCQRREPGDEINTGYVRTKAVTGEPPGRWRVTKEGKYACGRCEASSLEQLAEDHPALTAAVDRYAAASHADDHTAEGWPSITSPFEAHRRGSGVDGETGGGVHQDG
jgi:hypothetical protein